MSDLASSAPAARRPGAVALLVAVLVVAAVAAVGLAWDARGPAPDRTSDLNVAAVGGFGLGNEPADPEGVAAEGSANEPDQPGVADDDPAGEPEPAEETIIEGPGIVHGPLVGAVTDTSVRIWVRGSGLEPVRLIVAPPVVFASEWVTPTAAADFTYVFDVVGLEHDTEYAYRVVSQSGASRPGRFRTTPAAGRPAAWRLAFGSCTELDDQPIFDAVAAADPALFLFLGDNHYGNAATLDAQRAAYHHHRAIANRAHFLARTPVLAVWDDHDFLGNDTDGRTPGRDVALQAFGENWANPSAGTPDAAGVFFRHRWADVDLFMLDGRYHRGTDGSLLGEEQRTWLLDGLRESAATFKFVALGSRWTLNDRTDSFAQYAEEREEIFSAIERDAIEGVVLLSGDSHAAEFRAIPRGDDGYDLPEIVSSTLASHPQPCNRTQDVERDLVRCFDTVHHFVTVDTDTTLPDPTLAATIHDLDGAVSTWTIRRSQLRNDIDAPPLTESVLDHR